MGNAKCCRIGPKHERNACGNSASGAPAYFPGHVVINHARLSSRSADESHFSDAPRIMPFSKVDGSANADQMPPHICTRSHRGSRVNISPCQNSDGTRPSTHSHRLLRYWDAKYRTSSLPSAGFVPFQPEEELSVRGLRSHGWPPHGLRHSIGLAGIENRIVCLCTHRDQIPLFRDACGAEATVIG